MQIGKRYSMLYFDHLKTLFPGFLQAPKQVKYKAEDPLNNLLNLGYEVLKGEVYRGVIYANLDTYLHSIQFGKPSLVCDIQEVFRWLIDEFLISYSRKLKEDTFENKGGRIFLKKESYRLIKAVNELFDRRIKHQRIKRFGECSKIRAAIREEPMRLAQSLRDKKGRYEPIKGELIRQNPVVLLGDINGARSQISG